MGRIGYFLRDAGDVLERDELAHDLLFLTRGQPVVYYGDEQGFAGVGDGKDKNSRQTLFASQVAEYQNQALVTGETAGSVDRYDTDAPIYEHIAALAQLREDHPALVTGSQIERYATNGAGVYAFSRVDRDEKVEYLVALNNATSAQTVDLTTLTASASFAPVYGDGAAVTTDASACGIHHRSCPSAVVWRADKTVSAPDAAAAITVSAPAPAPRSTGSVAVSADVDDATWQETSFAWRVVGSDDWTPLGTAEDTDPRVFHDIRGLANGTLVEYRAVSTDAAGHRSAASTYASVGNQVSLVVEEEPEIADRLGQRARAASTPRPAAPATGSPSATPSADDARRRRSGAGTFDLPAGDYEYKIATREDWDENYGAGGAPGGANIPLTHDGGTITFYFDPRTNIVQTTSTADGPIVTLPGSFQRSSAAPATGRRTASPASCPTGTATASSSSPPTTCPPVSYEVKVAHGLSWDENYGAGGAPGGATTRSAASDGKLVTFRYTLATHILTIKVDRPAARRAPASCARTGSTPRRSPGPPTSASRRAMRRGSSTRRPRHPSPSPTARSPVATPIDLAWSTAASPPSRRRASRRSPASPPCTSRAGPGCRRRPAARTAHGRRSATPTARSTPSPASRSRVCSTTCTRPSVEDDALGVTFKGEQADVPAVGADRAGGDAAHVECRRRRRPGAPRGDVGRGIRCLDRQGREVASRATSTCGRSSSTPRRRARSRRTSSPTRTRSRSRRTPSGRSRSTSTTRPGARRQWEKTKAPVIDRPVDRAIYELHIRDFSITDETVPEEERGTYRAFTRDSAGTAQLRQLADAGINTVHLLPVVRPRDDRGEPRRAGGARLRPRVVRPGSDRAAGVHRRGRRRRRLQLGLRPVPLLGARGLVRRRPRGRRARARVPRDGGRAARHGPAGRARRGLQPHRAVGPGREVGARQGRARLLPAPQPGGRRRDLDVLPERRDRARRSPRSSWSTRSSRGRASTRSTASASTSWATTRRQNMLAIRAALDELTARRRTASTARRSTCTARAGTSARSRTTPSSSRRRRGSSAAPASARSPTGCATPCTAAARSPARRCSSRASAPDSAPTPTARRSTARPSRRSPTSRTRPIW